MKEIIVKSKYDGKKLNSFLLDNFDGLSMNLLYKTLRKKDIRVNNVKVNQNIIIHTGDNIKVYIPDDQLFAKLPAFDILYEDNNIMIINKPTGIEVVGSNDSLTNLILKQKSSLNSNQQISKENIFLAPCHRLDRNTSGLVLFAKNETSLSILLEKFKNREIEKIYRARIYGIPPKKEQLLTAYLFKDNKKSVVYISDSPKKGYVKILTYYKLIESNIKENTSLLEINLLTGKTHQIRAHLAHIGYPILGDGKYGNNQINKKFGYKFQQLKSYSITFKFTTESGCLEYLNNHTFKFEI